MHGLTIFFNFSLRVKIRVGFLEEIGDSSLVCCQGADLLNVAAVDRFVVKMVFLFPAVLDIVFGRRTRGKLMRGGGDGDDGGSGGGGDCEGLCEDE